MIPIPVFALWAAGIVLALSMASNAGLSWLWLGERDARVVAEERGKAESTAAQACSAGVQQLEDAQTRRQREMLAALKSAGALAAQRNARADAILAVPAAVPGDDCASARARVDGWLQGRAQP